MKSRPRSCLPLLLGSVLALCTGCSRGGQGGADGEDPAADLASGELPGDGPPGPAPDAASPSDLALPPAEGRPLWGRGYANVDVVDVAAAPDGSLFLTGSFSRADFGEGEVRSNGPSDVFLVKLDRLGQRKWVRTFGRAYFDQPDRVTADKDGNVAVVGYSLRAEGTGSHDALVAVYAADGTERFTRHYGGPKVTAVDTAISAAFAPDGSLWVTGGFEDRISFGGGDLISEGDRDLYLLHLGPTGAHLLSKRYGFTGYDQSSGLSVLPDGDVVAVGPAGYPIDFGDGNVGTDPSVDTFFARFSPMGVARWSKRLRLRQYSSSSLAVGPGGTIWLIGDLNGSVDFGGGPRTPPTGRGIYWAQYSGAGAHLGSYVLPSNSGIYLTQGAVDSTGQIILGGVVEGDLDFGGGVTKPDAGRAFFFKSSADGRVRWSFRFGGTNSDKVAGVAVLPGDQAVAAALVSKPTTLGAVSLGTGGALLTVTP